MSELTQCVHIGLAGDAAPPRPWASRALQGQTAGAPAPRPLADALMAERRTGQIHLRVSPAQFAAWRAKAHAAGLPLSDLLRQDHRADAIGNGREPRPPCL